MLTIGLLAGCVVLAASADINLFPPLVVGTSIWVAVDSVKFRLQRYQSGIAYGPVVLGILCSMFWVVAFPWYLYMRHKILTGKARLRPEFEPWDMASGQMSPKGLVQPWQGRKL